MTEPLVGLSAKPGIETENEPASRSKSSVQVPVKNKNEKNRPPLGSGMEGGCCTQTRSLHAKCLIISSLILSPTLAFPSGLLPKYEPAQPHSAFHWQPISMQLFTKSPKIKLNLREMFFHLSYVYF